MTDSVVQVADIGFWQGRQYRSFLEFNIPTGQSVVVRFTAATDFVLKVQNLAVDSGGIRLTAYRGATSGGSWTLMPVIAKNIMGVTPVVAAKSIIETGGTVSGGTPVEIVRVVTSNSTARAASVGQSTGDERGLAAGVYHIKLENLSNGAATGVYTLIFEERPSGTYTGI